MLGFRSFVMIVFLLVVGLSAHRLARAETAGSIEISVGGSFNRSDYADGNFEWTRRFGGSVGYFLFELSEIEFSFQDSTDRTSIPGFEDTTFHDQIYSVDWVQALTTKNYYIQPFVKVGIGQLYRDASGSYVNGITPPSQLGEVTGVIGGGLKLYLTRTFAIKLEATSYLAGGKLGTWNDNYAITYGISYLF